MLKPNKHNPDDFCDDYRLTTSDILHLCSDIIAHTPEERYQQECRIYATFIDT